MSTDAYVLLAALGGSLITALATIGAVFLTAGRATRAAQAQRRLEAYADLLVTAGDVLGTYRQTWDTVREVGQLDAEGANKRMTDLASALHRASAVVALTGSAKGRQYGEILYSKARKLTATRVVPFSSGTDRRFTMLDSGSHRDVEEAIEEYKAALLPEITAMP